MEAILGVAPLKIVLQRHFQCCSVVTAFLHHSYPTIYLVLEFETNWLKNELLNGFHFEGGAAGNGAAVPRTAP